MNNATFHLVVPLGRHRSMAVKIHGCTLLVLALLRLIPCCLVQYYSFDIQNRGGMQ